MAEADGRGANRSRVAVGGRGAHRGDGHWLGDLSTLGSRSRRDAGGVWSFSWPLPSFAHPPQSIISALRAAEKPSAASSASLEPMAADPLLIAA